MTQRYDFKTGSYTLGNTMGQVAKMIDGLHAQRPLDFILVGEFHTVTSHKAAQLVLTDRLAERSLVGAFADELPAAVMEQTVQGTSYKELVADYGRKISSKVDGYKAYRWLEPLALDAHRCRFTASMAMYIQAAAHQIPFQLVDCPIEYGSDFTLKGDLSPMASKLLQSSSYFQKIAADHPAIIKPEGLDCKKREGMLARDLTMAASAISLKAQTPQPVLMRVGQSHLAGDHSFDDRPLLPHMLTEAGYNIVTVSMIPEPYIWATDMACNSAAKNNPRPENLAGDIRVNTYGTPNIECELSMDRTTPHNILFEDIHTMLHDNRKGPRSWVLRMIEKYELAN